MVRTPGWIKGKNMKQETIIKNWPALMPFADQLTGETRRNILDLLQNLFEFGYCRPCYTVGRGRYVHFYDYKNEISSILKNLGFSAVMLNDAPRGGRTGDIVALDAVYADCNAVTTTHDGERFAHVCFQGGATKKISASVCNGVLFSHYEKCENKFFDKGVM